MYRLFGKSHVKLYTYWSIQNIENTFPKRRERCALVRLGRQGTCPQSTSPPLLRQAAKQIEIEQSAMSIALQLHQVDMHREVSERLQGHAVRGDSWRDGARNTYVPSYGLRASDVDEVENGEG